MPRRFFLFGCLLRLSWLGAAESPPVAEVALPPAPKLAVPSLEPKVELKPKPPKEPSAFVFTDQLTQYEIIPGPRGLIELFGGEAVFRAVWGAQRVEIVKLKLDSLTGPNAPVYTEAGSVVLSSEDAAALQTRATLDGSYGWEDFPECLPVYGFRFKFRSKERVVVLDLCFECAMLRVLDPRYPPAEASFEPVYNDYVALINRYFKDEPLRPRKR